MSNHKRTPRTHRPAAHRSFAPSARARPDEPPLPSEIYHENSKLRPHDYGLYTWIAFVNSSEEIGQVVSRPATSYKGFPELVLPRPAAPAPGSFGSAIVNRRSVRTFSGEPIDLASLAGLLYFGDGVVHVRDGSDGSTWLLRAAPSGGALYPLELYCVVRNVVSVKPGVYFYDPSRHLLHRVADGDATRDLTDAMPSARASIEASCVSIVLASVLPRIRFKYGERSYRFALLEAGHIAQNILLAAQDLGLGALPIGGFLDDHVNRLLGLDGVDEVALYVLTIGSPERAA